MILSANTTTDELFVWVLHRFVDEFEDHAVLKGGMALRLTDSPRYTTDIDYILVPCRSKKDVLPKVENVVAELKAAGAMAEIKLHSTMIRIVVLMPNARLQVEIEVREQVPSSPFTTAAISRPLGIPAKVIRIVDHDHALANKIAAWAERRLVRDLYDIYFLHARLGAKPEAKRLDERLTKFRSRLPKYRAQTAMTRQQLRTDLENVATTLSPALVAEELAGLLPANELPGLDIQIRSALIRVVEILGP